MSERIDELVKEAAFLDDSGCDKCEMVAELADIARAAEERVRVAEAKLDFERRVAKDLAESLVDAGWCRPTIEREYAPCQEDGETCRECAYIAAREAVERSDR